MWPRGRLLMQMWLLNHMWRSVLSVGPCCISCLWGVCAANVQLSVNSWRLCDIQADWPHSVSWKPPVPPLHVKNEHTDLIHIHAVRSMVTNKVRIILSNRMCFLVAVSRWIVSLLITRESNWKISDWTQKGTSPIYCSLVKYIILTYNRNYNSKGLKAASLFLDFGEWP